MKHLHDHEINKFNKDHIQISCLEAGHEYNIHIVSPTARTFGGTLKFQNGPVKEAGANGITDEALIAVVLDRLRYLNDEHEGGKYRCRENSLAITKLEESLHWLQHRSQARERRGVEGTPAV